MANRSNRIDLLCQFVIARGLSGRFRKLGRAPNGFYGEVKDDFPFAGFGIS